MNAIRTFLHDIIDYAGLYPPAGLPLEEVVRNYAAYRRHPAAWMLARLIIPVHRLEEFAETARSSWLPSPGSLLPWRISCLVPAPEGTGDAFREAWNQVNGFNARHAGQATIDAVETRCESVGLLRPALDACEPGVATYWELPHTRPCDELLAVLAAGGSQHRAKIRTGGIQPHLIAAVADVAGFLHACAAARVAFKATAGLHHPVRAEYPLTYEANAPRATMHGFLNLFAAAVAAWRQRAAPSRLADILLTTDPDAFQFAADGLSVNGVRYSLDDLADTRRRFAIGFGSCSFSEPVEDLRRFGGFVREAAAQPD